MKKLAFFIWLSMTLTILNIEFPSSWLKALKISMSVVTLVISIFFLRKMFEEPLRKLAEMLERAIYGDIFIREKPRGAKEVKEVTKKVNALAERLVDTEVVKIEKERLKIESEIVESLKEELGREKEEVERFRKEAEERMRNLATLYEVTSAISSALELDEVLERITYEVGRRLGYSKFAILLKDEDGNLEVRAAYGFESTNIIGMKFSAGEGVSGIVAETGQMILIPDTRADKRYLHWKGEYLEEGSFLSIPVKYKGNVVGVFNFNLNEVNGFSQEDIRMLSAIADQAAVAIENAKLFTEVKRISETDFLTGLKSRAVFLKTISELIERGEEFSVLIADLDEFKRVNVELGHIFGDKVLREVADSVKSILRKTDVVARFGGDEFAFILPMTKGESTEKVAEKIIKEVSSRKFGDGKVSLTISMGIAEFPEDGKKPIEILEVADRELLRAKKEGRNRWIKAR